MAKVLLVQPNYNTDTPLLWKKEAWMPLALVALATFVREKSEGGHDIKILDRNLHYDNDKFIKLLDRFQPDIVGMTCYTSPAIKDIMQVAKLVKENSEALVFVGGVHATLEPKSLLDYEYIDYTIKGEGEETLLELCGLVDKRKATSKNILKLKNINYNEMRPFLNLNDCPLPDYDLLEFEKYVVTTFYTSRGCPGRCKFCYNLGRQLRFYNTQKTIEMFDRVIEKYKVKEFTIADDNFANLSKRTTDVCKSLSKHNCVFFCFLRTDLAHDKVLRELKQAGCLTIQFGFESGSQRVLDFINKRTTVEQNANAIRQCRKYGIFVEGSFMLGLPTETAKEAVQTLKFIENTGLKIAFTKIYKPFPSTELYDLCIKKGLIKRPKNLIDWVAFSNINNDGVNLNVSEIPTPLLLDLLKKTNKHEGSQYLKKFFILARNGHLDYALLRIRQIVKDKLVGRV